jgi:hypothetical protein
MPTGAGGRHQGSLSLALSFSSPRNVSHGPACADAAREFWFASNHSESDSSNLQHCGQFSRVYGVVGIYDGCDVRKLQFAWHETRDGGGPRLDSINSRNGNAWGLSYSVSLGPSLDRGSTENLVTWSMIQGISIDPTTALVVPASPSLTPHQPRSRNPSWEPAKDGRGIIHPVG